MTDLWYDETGEGPPLVLLHEGVVDSRIWEPVVPLLAERHRVIRYDQRGFGRSPKPDGPYSLVDDLVAVLDAAGLDKAALAGASRGGNISLATAVERPERVSTLILLGSGLPGVQLDVGWTPEQIARWERAEADDDWPAMAELDMEVWAPMGADPELRAMFVENAVWSNSEDPATRARRRRGRRHNRPHSGDHGGPDVPGINEIGDRLARRFRCSLGRNRGGRSHDSLAGA